MNKRIKRVLIANRGEIAVRVIRACKELGLETVQVYSQADRDTLAVKLADHSVCIGAPKSAASYLNIPFIISAAKMYGADAIHPGYGFLSENAEFARLCAENEIIFVGPSDKVISLMGDKATARKMAMEAGVPCTPGSEGVLDDVSAARKKADELGYPVILKASAGGGGRGMRIVRNEAEFDRQFQEAVREAKACFNDGSVYLERYLTRIRHIEIQVLSDGHQTLHLGERDCSVQRRNQKLLEESPSPVLDPSIRSAMGEAAVRLCNHVGYTNAGTIEFIFDESTRQFYFMEMNTRIQVEHPVSEEITGIDIVKEQLRIADGQPLGIAQRNVTFTGHAIECRINAEDPDRDFSPNPGLVTRYLAPGGPGIRVDSHLYDGYQVPPYYDSLLAKIVTWGATREEAIARMLRALGELKIDGLKTTAPFHERLLAHDAFRNGQIHTTFVEQLLREET